MINTSTEYQQAVAEKKRFIAKATCLLKDGTTLNFDQSNLMVGGVMIADGVTNSNKFDIGSAIINQLTLAIYNGNDEFSDYDFTDAVITVWVGMALPDRTEWIKRGVFNASDPTTTPDVISLKALDNMVKFDTAYDGRLSFPTTLQTIVQHCCTQCGVLLVNGQFPNYGYRIEKDPFEESGITYRAIIAYCALLAGCFARCNMDGRLELGWYDTAAFNGITDGGIFDKTDADHYQTGVTLDGGNFTNYNGGDAADGGTFTEKLPYHHIYSFSSLSVSTEDVVITGIRVKASDGTDTAGEKTEGETYLCGAEGYILDVSGNPLIEAGKAKAVAEYLAGRIVGMRFRPFTASAVGDPSWEAGDAAVITDRKGNSYYTYLTNITYSTGGYASMSCDAEPAARHSADRYDEFNKIVEDIKKDSQKQLSSYAKYVDQMNQLAINAMGYYETTVVGDDGSKIHYMHDKPLLSDSKIVYKQSIDGFFWSKDGGVTWTGGVDKDGNAVMNVIAAIGISFDWAKGGTLTLGGENNGNGKLTILDNKGKEIGYADNTGVHFKQGSISGTDVTSRGLGYVGSILESVYIKLTDGTVQFWRAPYNSYTPSYRAGSIDTGYSMNFGVIAPKTTMSGFNFYIHPSDTEKASTPLMQLISESPTIINRANLKIRGRIHVRTTAEIGGIFWQDSENVKRDGFGPRQDPSWSGDHSDGTLVHGALYGTALVFSGSKSRVVTTEDYSDRLLYCYEMPSPMFGDIGEGITDNNGECYISIDDIFSETVAMETEYQVFLQKEGQGDLWVADKQKGYFVVKGTSDLKFAWEIKVRQRDYEYERLELIDRLSTSTGIAISDYEAQYIKEMEQLIKEKEALFNETA